MFTLQIDELGKHWHFGDDDEVDKPEVKSHDVTRCLVGSSADVGSCTANERLQPGEKESFPVLAPSTAASTNPTTQPPATTTTRSLVSSPPRSTTPVTAYSETECLRPYTPTGLDSIIRQLVTTQDDDDVTQNAESTCCSFTITNITFFFSFFVYLCNPFHFLSCPLRALRPIE